MTSSSTSGMTPKELAGLSLAAIGVVYGDIGTSPIYAIKESFHPAYGMDVLAPNILGVLSLIFWALTIVISVKYLTFVLQADNDGEGGIMALAALVRPEQEQATGWAKVLLLTAVFGATLLYGGSMITPAISVLSAVEGLQVATSAFEPYVVPITIGILLGLFAFQKRGTGDVGKIFGPVTSVWFLTLAGLGIYQLLQHPAALKAINPMYGVEFFLQNGWTGFFVLGSVFLVVTGGEALYAALGHFGTRPIRLSWFGFVLPSLLLNYFGQGALLLRRPEAISHPFFNMGPEWATYPLVAIATAATIIASQAVISGAFSLTRQAVQLGFLPRLDIQQTSTEYVGQVYIPAVNWVLATAAIGLVMGFQSSSSLASAYGVAVTTDMVFTTILFGVVAYRDWGWPGWALGALTGLFLLVDLSFWGAMLPKIPAGGWFPLVISVLFFVVMTTWKRGRQILSDRLNEVVQPLSRFLSTLSSRIQGRVPGTAIYMYSNPEGTPPALRYGVDFYRVLHERVIILTVVSHERPYIEPNRRLEKEKLAENIWRVKIHFGFAEEPAVPEVLTNETFDGWAFELEKTTFFLGQETLRATQRPGMAIWREKLFARMHRNATRATRFFHLPANQVVEIATRIEL